MARSVNSSSLCTAPTPANVFIPADSTANAWFILDSVSAGDAVVASWINPNGQTYNTFSFTKPTSSGFYCYLSTIDMSGHQAASLLGNWTVNVTVNGSRIFSLSFAVATSRVSLTNQFIARTFDSSSCSAPTPAATILTTDQQVATWFSVDGAAAGDQIKAVWSEPGGRTYGTTTWNPVSSNGSFCFWASQYVSGYQAGSMPGNWSVQVSWNGSPLYTAPFAIQPPNLTPQIASAVNAASLDATKISPGSLVLIQGQNPGVSATQPSGASGVNSLSGAGVAFDGVPAALLYADSGNIVAQVPWISQDLANIQVTVNGVESDPFPIHIAPSSPGIFTVSNDGTGLASVYIFAADNSQKGWMASNNPAGRTDQLMIQTTGLGAVYSPPPAGAPGSSDPNAPSLTYSPLSVTIGGLPAPVLFSNLDPNNVGIYDVFVQVPMYAPAGPAVPVQILTVSGISNAATLNIQGAPPVPNPATLTSVSNLKPAPFSTLQLNGSFDTAAPIGVSFSDGHGFTQNVTPQSVTASSIAVLTPPYFNTSIQDYGAGTVSVSVVYNLNGGIGSHALGNVQIQNLPPLAGKPGQLLSTLLRANQQNGRTQLAQLLLQEKSGAGGTAYSRSNVENFISQSEAINKAMSSALSGGTSTLSVGGKPVTVKNSDLTRGEQLLTALIVQQLTPGVLSPAPGGVSAAAEAGSHFRAETSSLPVQDPNVCMIPTDAEIYDAAHGGPKLVQGVPYAQRLDYCNTLWSDYNNLSLAVDISNSAAKLGDKISNWLTGGSLANNMAGLPAAEQVAGAVDGVTMLNSGTQLLAQGSAFLVAQTLTPLVDPNTKDQALQKIAQNSLNVAQDVALDQTEAAAAKNLAGGDLLKSWIDASQAAGKAALESDEKSEGPQTSQDSQGDVQSQFPTVNSGIQVEGTVTLAPGEASSDVQVSLSTGTASPPGSPQDLAVAPVYDDGSYDLVAPQPGGAVPNAGVLDVQDPSGWYSAGMQDLTATPPTINISSPEATSSSSSSSPTPPPTSPPSSPAQPFDPCPPNTPAGEYCAGVADSLPMPPRLNRPNPRPVPTARIAPSSLPLMWNEDRRKRSPSMPRMDVPRGSATGAQTSPAAVSQ